MTPATLRRLEWAGPRMTCLVCDNGFRMRHWPNCELDAAIREAERRETGERPEIRVGDIVSICLFGDEFDEPEVGRVVDIDEEERIDVEFPNRVMTLERRHVWAIYRDPLWRKEAPTP